MLSTPWSVYTEYCNNGLIFVTSLLKQYATDLVIDIGTGDRTITHVFNSGSVFVSKMSRVSIATSVLLCPIIGI